MLLSYILVKKGRFIFLPQRWMLFLKPLQYCFHYGLSEEF